MNSYSLNLLTGPVHSCTTMPWLLAYHMILYLVCVMWDVREYQMTIWYAFWYVVCFFKTTENFNLVYLKVKHYQRHCIKRKNKFVWCMGQYYTPWEPSCTTLDLQSCVALLGIKLMEYGLTHHTVISFSLNITSRSQIFMIMLWI